MSSSVLSPARDRRVTADDTEDDKLHSHPSGHLSLRLSLSHGKGHDKAHDKEKRLARATHRLIQQWSEWGDWPFQCILLPILVAFAFCLVLFLGAKNGARLASVHNWLPGGSRCTSLDCARAAAWAGGGNLGPGGIGGTGSGQGVSGALTGLSGLLGLNSYMMGGGQAGPDLDPLGLDDYDRLKLDLRYWLAEAIRQVGLQTKDCEEGYGMSYIDRWRRSRVAWCSAPGAGQGGGAGGRRLKGSGGAATTAGAGSGSGLASSTGSSSGSGSGSSSSGKGSVNASTAFRLSAAASAASFTATLKGAAATASKSAMTAAGKVSLVTKAGSKGYSSSSSSSSSGGGSSKGGSSSSSSGSSAAAAAAKAAAAASAAAAAGPKSSIALFPFEDKQAQLMFAVSTNTVLDTNFFLGTSAAAMPAAPPGSFRAACKVDNRSTPAAGYMAADGVKRWMKDALRDEAYDNVRTACAAPPALPANATSSGRTRGPVAHPVLLLSRRDPLSAQATLEDLVSTFVSLLVLDDPVLQEQGLQVAVVDGKPDGPYLDVWAALSRPYPLRMLSRAPWSSDTCLTRAVHSASSAVSILTSMGPGNRVTCRSPLVTAASLWLRHLMGPAVESPFRSAFKPAAGKAVRKTVVWVSRRSVQVRDPAAPANSQEPPRLRNEGEVVLELQREVWRWNDESCLRTGGAAKTLGAVGSGLRRLLGRGWGRSERPVLLTPGGEAQATAGPGTEADTEAGDGGERRRLASGGRCRPSNTVFELRVVELGDMAFFPEQLQVLGGASILAGVHGPGLANMVWMAPGKGAVLEVQHNSDGDVNFHNQAYMLGHRYMAVSSDGSTVSPVIMAAGLRKLMDALA
ncbi:hypothetical protein HYH03_007398 [Edaphochlamys debaryana]|uniref:Uncharacterized protein n=1 Tax=Edaphochlamys debaryana TaxID=47281 RepID=A0A835Y1S4_9CHLO|nr:hypothetical protein HYH03_007398 [Edaphochlamys debaryana]|eukprot:KAG2494341.1 hypothetical protein HYH03_007398 [Edaphochlamys debaryana]